jgi:pimeloyl-ACP methyl ester carboxylesterase
MARLKVNGVELEVVERGSGSECIVFSHSYLVDHRHFEAQMAALEDRYRIIAYDHRDHGQSARVDGAYGIYDLVADGAAVIEATGAAPCHWVGLSTGGFVGMRLALQHRDKLKSLTLMDTSAEAEGRLVRMKYHALMLALRVVGIRPLVGEAAKSLLGRTTLDAPERAELLALWRDRMADNDPDALIRFGKAIWSRDDVLDALRATELPTLIVVGAEDRSLPPVHARRMHEAIAGSRLEIIEDAGHLCTVERPERVSEVLTAFIDEVAAS